MRRGLVCLVLALLPAVSFAAEPLTMLLIHIIRQQLESAIENAIETSRRERERPPIVVPSDPYDIDDGKLRALIDEGFVYLTRAQRDEVFASVKRVLSDARNKNMRAVIVHELAVKASAVRQAHERLAALSQSEKRALAAQAREEYEKLPVAERRQMIDVLRMGTVPLPRDLNDMILAEFSSVPAVPPAPAQAQATE